MVSPGLSKFYQIENQVPLNQSTGWAPIHKIVCKRLVQEQHGQIWITQKGNSTHEGSKEDADDDLSSFRFLGGGIP